MNMSYTCHIILIYSQVLDQVYLGNAVVSGKALAQHIGCPI